MRPAPPPPLEAGPRRARIDGVPPLPQQIFLREARARLDAALAADIGFAERLAWFWSNHFCISADKGPLRPVVGAYEREAIRPHVTGRFADMLQAVESHPGMLIYLDNARSIGPDSIAGRNRGKGLNENLAREILELHTLGVRTVYTQTDVTRFAAVITGWTVVPPREPQGGVFTFNPRMHEPGAQTILGKTYPDGELEQGKAVLATLARHPATAKHVAAKLVRHFVSDEPIPALADKLAKRFMATDGDLKEVAIALVNAPEAWDMAHRKLKRPGEWIVASLRAADVAPPEIAPGHAGAEPARRAAVAPRRRPRALPTTRRHGSTASPNVSTCRTNCAAGSPAGSIPRPPSRLVSARSPPRRRGRRSAAPKAGPRH